MRISRRATGVASAALALVALAGPASADDSTTSTQTEQIASTVSDATPAQQASEDVAATKDGTGGFTTDGDVAVSIPADAADPVAATTSTDTGTVVAVEVGTGTAAADAGQLASDGSVVYAGDGSTDRTVQPTTDGFRIHTVIDSADAPTEYVHAVSLSDGVRMVAADAMPGAATEDGATPSGAVFLVDASGTVVGGFAAPWAKDSVGHDVPTHFEVRGSELVQVVEHRSQAVTYPVVADPYLGFGMIKSAAWKLHSEGWTLEVTPTGWARWNAGGYLPGVAGWNELYAKYRNRGLNTNLDGMRDQFICHQQLVALRAPNKPTWNLDEWRPDVSYLATLNASCNPGGSKWFD